MRIFTLILLTTFLITPIVAVQSLVDKEGLDWTEDQPRYGGTLHAATLNDPRTFSGMLTGAGDDWRFIQYMSNGLVKFIHDETYGIYTPVPDIALSWDFSDDGLTYTFYLDPDACWSDGTPLTAQEVKWNVETAREYHFLGEQNFGKLASIETPDDHTIIFTLTETYSEFGDLYQFNAFWGSMLPRHIFEGTDILTNPRSLVDPVTTGPFRVKEYVKGSHAILERNPNYWKKDKWGNQLPYLDQVIVHIVPSTTVMVAGLDEGDYHRTPVSAENYQWLKSRADTGLNDLKLSEYTPITDGQDTMIFNMRREIIGNLKVRQALVHIIQGYKQQMIDNARFGLASEAFSVIGTGGGASWAFADPRTDPDVPFYEYDPVKANQLLDEAGYPKGSDGIRFSIGFLVCNCRPEEVKMGEIMREAFRDEIGVDLVLDITDNPTWITRTFVDWNFDISIRTYDTGPVIGNLRSRYHTDSIVRMPWRNAAGYSSQIVDDAMSAALAAPNREISGPLWRTVQIEMLKDLPYYALISTSNVIGRNLEFRGPGAYLGMKDDGWGLGRLNSDSDRMWWTLGEPVPLWETTVTDTPPVTDDVTGELEARIDSLESDILDIKGYISELSQDIAAIPIAGTDYMSYIGIVIGLIAVVYTYTTSRE